MYKILIVEDEYLSRYVTGLVISRNFGTKVELIQAENSIEAKKIIDNKKIDFVIMDTNIAGIRSIELCKYIRIKYKNLPIIITISDYNGKLIEKMLKLNISDYLIKPIKPLQIIETLNKYIKEDKDFKEKENFYLKKISKNFIQYRREETIETIREYIDYLYIEDIINDDLKEIKTLIEQIKYMCDKLNISISKKEQEEIKDTFSKNFTYINKEQVIIKITNIIEHIFDNILVENHDTLNLYIREAIDYVEKNIRKNITLDEVANYINITPHYLSKIFKREVGVNFITFITDKKIEVAKKMLINENIPIINIALELSYTQPNYFSKVFKKKVGITPSEYRENYLLNKKAIKN